MFLNFLTLEIIDKLKKKILVRLSWRWVLISVTKETQSYPGINSLAFKGYLPTGRQAKRASLPLARRNFSEDG